MNPGEALVPPGLPGPEALGLVANERLRFFLAECLGLADARATELTAGSSVAAAIAAACVAELTTDRIGVIGVGVGVGVGVVVVGV